MTRAPVFVLLTICSFAGPARAGFNDLLRARRAAPAPAPCVRTFTPPEDARAAQAMGLNPAEWISRLNHFERTLDGPVPERRLAIERFVATELLRKALDPAAHGGAFAAAGFYDHYALNTPAPALTEELTRVTLDEIGQGAFDPPAWDAVVAARRFFFASRRPNFYLISTFAPRFDRTDLYVENLRPGVDVPAPVRAVLDFRDHVRPSLARIATARERLLRAPPSHFVDAALGALFAIEVRVGDYRELKDPFRAERDFVTRVRGARSARATDVLAMVPQYFAHPGPARAGRTDQLNDLASLYRWLEEKWYAPSTATLFYRWRVKSLKAQMRASLLECDPALFR